MSLGVTSDGFAAPTMDEVRAFVVQQWRGRFGEDSPTASNTANGRIVDVLTAQAYLSILAAHSAYRAGYVRSATGVGLDAVVANLGVSRIPDARGVATVLLFGTDGAPTTTPVPASTTIWNATTGRRYETTAGITLDSADEWHVLTIDAAGIAPAQVFDIGAGTYSSGASPDFLTRTATLVAAINAGTDAVAAGFGVRVAIRCTPPAPVSVGMGSGPATVRAANIVTARAIQAYDGGLGVRTILLDVVPNVEGALNVSDPTTLTSETLPDETPGTIAETDGELIARYLGLFDSVGGSSAARARSALARLPGVTDVVVLENETDADLTPAGQPAHSIEPVIRGGRPSQVAATLAGLVPAGIQCYGTDVTRTVDGKTVSWTLPVDVPVTIDIDVTKGEGWPVGLSDVDAIQAIGARVLQGLTTPGDPFYLHIGRDVYIAQVAGLALGAVPGMAGLSVELNGFPTTISVGTREQAAITIGTITIL
jgi:uncharacterized phage protein gp47/JayE